jgi:hypothetical protein
MEKDGQDDRQGHHQQTGHVVAVDVGSVTLVALNCAQQGDFVLGRKALDNGHYREW